MIAAILALMLAAAPADAQVGAAQRQPLFSQLHDQQQLLEQEHRQLDRQRDREEIDRQNLGQQLQIDRMQDQIQTQQLQQQMQQTGPAASVR